jgi:hypothetical protein
MKKPKFKVGDKVRVKTNEGKIYTYFDDLSTVGEVVKYPDDLSYRELPAEQKARVVILGQDQTVHVDDIELVQENTQVTNKFKVGDKVNVTYSEYWNGSVITGYKPDYPSAPYRFTHPEMGLGAEKGDNLELVEEATVEPKPVVDTSNPNKTPWGKMTPEEKGALLLAYHEGKVIEVCLRLGWSVTYKPSWWADYSYRVKPEAVVETVKLYSIIGETFAKDGFGNYKITYQTVDGEPDWSTLKGETL